MSQRSRLTDAFLRGFKLPDNKSVCLTDPSGKLEVRISPTSKVWRFQYRFAGRPARRIVIGEWPHVSYEAAKKQASIYERALAEGRDPAALVYRPVGAAKLRNVLEHHLSTLSNENTHAHVRNLYKDVLKAHGDTLVRDFTALLLRDWLDTNYAHRRGAAAVLLRNLIAAFNKAAHPLSPINMPPQFVNPAKGPKPHLALFEDHEPGSFAVSWEAEEWEAVMNGIGRAYDLPKLWKPGVMVIELLMLTGARPSEIKSLRWSEIEEQRMGGKLLTRIVKQAHKTRRTTGKPRYIFLGEEALRVIDRAREHRHATNYEGDFVFPQRRKQKNQKREFVYQLTHYAQRISKLAGLDFVPYNLRSGYINHTLDAVGYEHLEDVAENVGHTDTNTTKKHYRRLTDARVIAVAERGDKAFGDRRLQAVHGSPTTRRVTFPLRVKYGQTKNHPSRLNTP